VQRLRNHGRRYSDGGVGGGRSRGGVSNYRVLAGLLSLPQPQGGVLVGGSEVEGSDWLGRH
jgi:hypothetical protein